MVVNPYTSGAGWRPGCARNPAGHRTGLRHSGSGAQWNRSSANCRGWKSATGAQQRQRVVNLLRDEINSGHRIVVQEKPTIANALGGTDKPDSDKVRIIMDASFPKKLSLNNYANPEHYTLDTVDDAVALLDKNRYQAKIDLKCGYRSVSISRHYHQFTGLKWKFTGDCEYTYMTDTRLCMGISKNPSIFKKYYQFVEWCAGEVLIVWCTLMITMSVLMTRPLARRHMNIFGIYLMTLDLKLTWKNRLRPVIAWCY